MKLTLTQIDTFRRCIKRELNKRKWFYPKWIAAGKMKQEEADFELQTMEEIANYFDWLQLHSMPEQQKLF